VDYPGVLPFERARTLFKRDLTLEEKSVRGMLVSGLSDKDMYALDVFEGSVSVLYCPPGHSEQSLPWPWKIITGISQANDSSPPPG